MNPKTFTRIPTACAIAPGIVALTAGEASAGLVLNNHSEPIDLERLNPSDSSIQEMFAEALTIAERGLGPGHLLTENCHDNTLNHEAARAATGRRVLTTTTSNRRRLLIWSET